MRLERYPCLAALAAGLPVSAPLGAGTQAPDLPLVVAVPGSGVPVTGLDRDEQSTRVQAGGRMQHQTGAGVAPATAEHVFNTHSRSDHQVGFPDDIRIREAEERLSPAGALIHPAVGCRVDFAGPSVTLSRDTGADPGMPNLPAAAQHF